MLLRISSLLLSAFASASIPLPATAAAAPPAVFTRVAIMGQSKGSVEFTPGQEGLWENLEIGLGQQIEHAPDATTTYFTSGDAASLQTVQLPAVLATNAEACLVVMGNEGDFEEGFDPQSVAVIYIQICQALSDHGIVPILCTPLPEAPGVTDPAYTRWLIRLHASAAAIASVVPSLILVDWTAALDTDLNGVGDAACYQPNYAGLSFIGQQRLTETAVAAMAPHVRPRDIFASAIWDTINPTMLGPGPRPYNWYEQVVPAIFPSNGAIPVSSVIARTAALGQWWQMDMSPLSAGSTVTIDVGPYITFNSQITRMRGERVEMLVEYETDPGLPSDWSITCDAGQSGYDFNRSRGGSAMSALPSGILRAGPVDIAPGTAVPAARITLSGSGTIRLGRVGFHRLPPPYPGPYTGDLDFLDHGGARGQAYYVPDLSVRICGQLLVEPPTLTAIILQTAAIGTFTGNFYLQNPQDLGSPTDLQDIPGAAVGGVDSFRLSGNGSFTARCSLDGVSFPLKGSFTFGNEASTYQNVTLPGGRVGHLSARLYQGSDRTIRIVGEMIFDDSSPAIVIDLVHNGDPPAYGSGAYTLVIPGDHGGPASVPRGDGFATLTVSNKGAIRCQGLLADGTRFTRSGAIGGGAIWQFYFPVYGKASAGLLAGHLNLRPSDVIDDKPASDLEGVLSWRRAANAKTTDFPAGFQVERTLYGSRYTPPAKGVAFLPGLTASSGANAVLEAGAGAVPAVAAASSHRGHTLRAHDENSTATADGADSHEDTTGDVSNSSNGSDTPTDDSDPATDDHDAGIGAPPITPLIVNPPVGDFIGADGSLRHSFAWNPAKDAAAGTGFSLRANRRTGLVTGTYTNATSGARLTFNAVLLQDASSTGGSGGVITGFFKSKTGAMGEFNVHRQIGK